VANRRQRRASARKGSEDTASSEELDSQQEGTGGDPAHPFPDHEEDALFKTQMKLQQMVLGHWKTGLMFIIVMLLGVLGYGYWESHSLESQQAIQTEIAKISWKMPKSAGIQLPGQEPDPNLENQFKAGAGHFETIATETTGAGAVMAWMKAGSAWELGGDDTRAAAAYAAAHAVGAPGVLGWSAASAHAAALQKSDDLDGAAAILRAQVDMGRGLLSEQALIVLGEMYEDAGRTQESRSIYTEFAEKFPKSVLMDQVKSGLTRVGSGE